MTYEEREAQKEAARREDIRRLVAGEVTVEELRRENTAIHISGERIDYASSKSRFW